MNIEDRRTILSPLSSRITSIMQRDGGGSILNRLSTSARALQRYSHLVKTLVIDVNPERQRLFNFALSSLALTMVGVYEIIAVHNNFSHTSNLLPATLVAGCISDKNPKETDTGWQYEKGRTVELPRGILPDDKTLLEVKPHFKRVKSTWKTRLEQSIDENSVSWYEGDIPPNDQTVKALQGELRGRKRK